MRLIGMVRRALVVCLLVLGCSSPERPPAPSTPTPVCPPCPSCPAAAAVDAAPRLVLPAVRDACRTDADCALTGRVLEGDLTCCFGCLSTAGAADWVKEVEAICRGHEPAGCGALACPANATAAVCERGKCKGVLRQ